MLGPGALTTSASLYFPFVFLGGEAGFHTVQSDPELLASASRAPGLEASTVTPIFSFLFICFGDRTSWYVALVGLKHYIDQADPNWGSIYLCLPGARTNGVRHTARVIWYVLIQIKS